MSRFAIPDSRTNLFAGSFFSMEMTTSNLCRNTGSNHVVVINFQCSADDKVVRSPLSLKKHPSASLTSWINLVIFVSIYMLYCGPSVSSKRTRPISSLITMIWLNPREGKMKRVLCSDWLIDRARWLFIAGSGLPALILQKKDSIWLLYWPSLFGKDGWILARFFLPIKRTGPLSNHLYRTRTVNNAYILT